MSFVNENKTKAIEKKLDKLINAYLKNALFLPAFCQLFNIKKELKLKIILCLGRESNPRRLALQASALPLSYRGS